MEQRDKLTVCEVGLGSEDMRVVEWFVENLRVCSLPFMRFPGVRARSATDVRWTVDWTCTQVVAGATASRVRLPG